MITLGRKKKQRDGIVVNISIVVDPAGNGHDNFQGADLHRFASFFCVTIEKPQEKNTARRAEPSGRRLASQNLEIHGFLCV